MSRLAMITNAAPLAKTVKNALVEALLLRRAESVVAGYSTKQHEVIRRLCQAADARLALADDTSDSKLLAATLPLYREAIGFLVAAIAVSEDRDERAAPIEPAAAALRIEAFICSGAAKKPPASWRESLAILVEADPTPRSLNSNTGYRQRALLEKLAHWLRSQVEPRTTLRIRVSRVSRIMVTSGLLIGLLTWGVSELLAPTNLALNKPVRMSSRHPTSPDPQGATDGKIVGPFQACTNLQPGSWMVVDLEVVHSIDEIRIYNRTDGLYADTLPLTLELSSDGKSYTALDVRTTPFTGSQPWVVQPEEASGRFVRIRGRPSHGYVVVSEIEVYGE